MGQNPSHMNSTTHATGEGSAIIEGRSPEASFSGRRFLICAVIFGILLAPLIVEVFVARTDFGTVINKLVMAVYAPAIAPALLVNKASAGDWLAYALVQALAYSILGAWRFRGWIAVVGLLLLVHFALACLVFAWADAMASV